MIGESERFRGPGDVPVVSVERRENDLPLRVRFERLERPGRRGRISGFLSLFAANLRWDVVGADDVGV